MKTFKQLIGRTGEDLACEYLKSRRHKIKDRNYLRKWGEIDIISEKEGKLYFIEVKTVTRSYICNLKSKENYKAEDNLHLYKTKRLKKTIQTYLLSLIKSGVDWQFDVIVVILSKEDGGLVRLERLENVVL